MRQVMQALCNNVYRFEKILVTSGWGATTYCQRGVLQHFRLLDSQGSLVGARLVGGTGVSMQILNMHEPTKMISQTCSPTCFPLYHITCVVNQSVRFHVKHDAFVLMSARNV